MYWLEQQWIDTCIIITNISRTKIHFRLAQMVQTRQTKYPIAEIIEVEQRKIKPSLIARFMGATWGPCGTDRTKVGPHVGPMNFAIWDYLDQYKPSSPILENQTYIWRFTTWEFRCYISILNGLLVQRYSIVIERYSYGCCFVQYWFFKYAHDWALLSEPVGKRNHQTSNISRTLLGNIIVGLSDVVGASPVGAAPTTSPFSTSTPDLNALGKDNCKTTRETFKFWDLVPLY